MALSCWTLARDARRSSSDASSRASWLAAEWMSLRAIASSMDVFHQFRNLADGMLDARPQIEDGAITQSVDAHAVVNRAHDIVAENEITRDVR